MHTSVFRWNFDAPCIFLRFLTLSRFPDIRCKMSNNSSQIFTRCMFLYTVLRCFRSSHDICNFGPEPPNIRKAEIAEKFFVHLLIRTFVWLRADDRASDKLLFRFVVAFGLHIPCYLFILERWLSCHKHTHTAHRAQIQHPFRHTAATHCLNNGAVAGSGCCAVSSSVSGSCVSERATLTSFAHSRINIYTHMSDLRNFLFSHSALLCEFCATLTNALYSIVAKRIHTLIFPRVCAPYMCRRTLLYEYLQKPARESHRSSSVQRHMCMCVGLRLKTLPFAKYLLLICARYTHTRAPHM